MIRWVSRKGGRVLPGKASSCDAESVLGQSFSIPCIGSVECLSCCERWQLSARGLGLGQEQAVALEHRSGWSLCVDEVKYYAIRDGCSGVSSLQPRQ